MIEFSNCCFCVPLRTGCLILGYLQLIASIILAIISIVTLVAVGAVVATADAPVNESAVAALVSVYVIILILVTVLLTFSILLVVGIHKERRSYVKAFLIYDLIFIILYAIMYIVRCATLPPNVGFIVGTLIQILLSIYFLLVIRSYWVIMGSNVNTA
ncbi:uncharacterized protein LOC123872945 [Maniola jurtina]|uniref:uncharacterized protein LOC123872945 n=1 Tax=Maniola jurtina TaxID=191418 RepID=UPI001E68B99A|nr:uncharacterized protein LOC123872945 [Maniola jurtina]XP_045773512.1 uncharacterized protein LOC123872945 [Maniola jurtina]